MSRKETIKNSFSKAARTYDNYAFMQKTVAQKLICLIDKDNQYKKIIELGCGTGYYSGLLKERFNNSDILCVDISKEMTDIAGKKNPSINFIKTDIERLEPDFLEEFDLITSNSVFHWLNNPKLFIKNLKKLKKKNKQLILSIFGNNTLSELQNLIDYPLISGSFNSKNEWELFLQNNFPDNFTLIHETIPKSYPDLISLLRSLKYTGVNVKENKNFIWNKSLIKNTEKNFLSKYNAITVSYEVFFIKISLLPSQSS